MSKRFCERNSYPHGGFDAAERYEEVSKKARSFYSAGWFGVVLQRWNETSRHWEYAFQYSLKRNKWELAKGGEESHDGSAWGTARREMWEETGIWLSWRCEGEYQWINHRGYKLAGEPAAGSRGYVACCLKDDDSMDGEERHWWVSLECYRKLDASGIARSDHLEVMDKIAWLHF